MKRSPFVVGDFDIKSVKEDDPQFFIVSGYASVYGNVDKAMDIVMPGAFAMDLMEKGNERPILWQHRSDQPIGVGVFEEKEEGLKVTIKMPKGDDFVNKRVMPQIKVGAVKGLSIGYYVVEEQYDREERINKLIKLRLRETSAVTFPCNEMAQITAAKEFLGLEDENKSEFKMYPLADEKTDWVKSEAIANIKENTGSNKEPSRNYYKGFLKSESRDSKDFDDYQLPYVKYIGEGFKIVPKAIYEIAGHLNHVKSTDNELKDFINSVYRKMGKEEPFKSGNKFFVDSATLKNMAKPDLKSVFDSENVILSSNAKEVVIEALRSPVQDGLVSEQKDDELLDLFRGLNKEMENL